jgi:hypothetical protein
MEDDHGCFAISIKIPRLTLPVYRRKHNVTEVIERYCSQIAWLSSTRPATQEEWLDVSQSMVHEAIRAI